MEIIEPKKRHAMKKSILTILALAMLAFVACTKEEDNHQGNSDIPTVNDNQMFFRGTTFEMKASALIPTQNDRLMCYIGAESTNSLYRLICDISTGLFGRTIDLAHPCADTAYGWYYLHLSDTSHMNGIALQAASDGQNIAMLDTVNYVDPNTGEGSCFISGTYVTTRDDSGIRVDLKGILKDKSPFAMKLFVPENEIRHEWK